jgi:trehalose 6-phosphate synthase
MTEALIVNPYDPDNIADAMNTALEMSLEERQARHAALRRTVFDATSSCFGRNFVTALCEGD